MRKLTKLELEIIQNKLKRGSNGGKQMAKLSSAESVWLSQLIDSLAKDHPDYLGSLIH